MNNETLDQFYARIVDALRKARYDERYKNEDAFENDVWNVVARLAPPVQERCLTSHTGRKGRSPAEWEKFSRSVPGPDVEVLGSKNRLDIVITHEQGTIGIEAKALGASGHTGKLTQGLGQAMLALANRDRTILIIHCSKAITPRQRQELRSVADKITARTRTSIIVVPRK